MWTDRGPWRIWGRSKREMARKEHRLVFWKMKWTDLQSGSVLAAHLNVACRHRLRRLIYPYRPFPLAKTYILTGT